MTDKIGIIYLQKDKFQLYSPYLANILEFKFVPEISLDFDLYNKPIFENLLKAFVVNNKIPAGSFLIIVADNASFIKDFTQAQPSSTTSASDVLQNQAKEFIEHVPFEEVAGRVFSLANGIRAYATNKEMFDGIKSVLEKQGFTIEMVTPAFAFGQEMSTSPGLNINVINTIFQKIDLVKSYNLLISTASPEETTLPNEKEEKETQPEEINIKEKKENKNLMLVIAISIIAIIFVITAIFLYLQFQETPNKKIANNQLTVSPTFSPQVVKSTTAPVSLAITDLTTQITSASTSALTENVRLALSKYGFKSIDIQTQQSLGVSSSLLIFSEKVNTETKTSVTADMKEIIPEILVQEKAGSNFDIIIILEK